MQRTLKLLVLCSALFSLLPVSAHPALVSGIVALVNDDPVTSYEVERETATMLREAEKGGAAAGISATALRGPALQRIIDRKLVEQKIKELRIQVGDDEVLQAIEDVKKQNNIGQEALENALAGQGISFDQYKAQLKEQLERLRLVSQEVRAKVQVGEQELQDYYAANRSRYSEEEKFRSRHILFRLPKDAGDEELKRVTAKANAVLKELQGGKDFAELARTNSEDPSAADGGDLGTFRRGEVLPEFEAVLANLKPGEISGLIRTSAGLHIIRLDERIAGKVRPFAEVKGEIEDQLYKKKGEDRFNQWVVELRKAAAIEVKEPELQAASAPQVVGPRRDAVSSTAVTAGSDRPTVAAVPPAAAGVDTEIADRLSVLKSLRTGGLISEQEYTAIRRRILDSL